MKRLALVIGLLAVLVWPAEPATTYKVLAIGFDHTALRSGERAFAVVVISPDAPTGGLLVNMRVDTSGVIGYPTQVRVPAGKNSGFFSVTGDRVSTWKQVTLTAYYGNTQQSGILEVAP